MMWLRYIFESITADDQLSPHVTRVLGQNPGMMTLQGTNSYILQPPSSTLAPLILIDTSSPHTAEQYVDLLFTHLHYLGLQAGMRETHFESNEAKRTIDVHPEEKIEQYKLDILNDRKNDPYMNIPSNAMYGPNAQWVETSTKERRLPTIEHIILTHRHLDHVGALPNLLTTLKEHGYPPPKLWKMPSPDEATLQASERDRPTTDAALWSSLPAGTFQGLNPFQPFHPIMPGLMISIIDPEYRHLLKYEKDGKPRWNDVPEMARVSVRCLKTPGHTADSISLILCEGEKGVFTGDTVLGQGTTVFTDLSACQSVASCHKFDRLQHVDMTSLKTLLSLRPNVIYPAHGPHIPTSEASSALIQSYITHRQVREDQIMAILTEISSSPESLRAKIEALLGSLQEQQEHARPSRAGGVGYAPVGHGEGQIPHGQGRPAAVWSVDDKSIAVSQSSISTESESDDVDQNGVKKKHADFGFIEDSASYAWRGKGKPPPKREKPEPLMKEELERRTAAYEAFPKAGEEGGGKISIHLICYLLYKTANEKVIAAAGKSIQAHLEKLEKDGKVFRCRESLPCVLEGVIQAPKEGEAWGLAENTEQ